MITRRGFLLALTAALAVGPIFAQEKAKPKAAKATYEIAEVKKDLEYGPHERNKLDLYLPKSEAKGLPLLVWIHGGGWQGGSKEGPVPLRFISDKDYVLASINYRLTNAGPFPAQIQDCKAAIRWLRAHAKEYGYDADRIAVWGASAGGHLVSLLGTTANMRALEGDGANRDQSARVQAVINWFGPTDFLNWGKPGVKVESNLAGGAIYNLFNGSVSDKLDLAKLASPITRITRDAAPMLFVHGDNDNLVPLQQSEIMHEALKKIKADTTLYVVKGGGHGPGFDEPGVAKACKEFLERTLKKTK